MTKLCRSKHLYIRFADARVPDPRQFLKGRAVPVSMVAPRCLSPVAGAEVPITADELRLLSGMPAHEWLEVQAAATSLQTDETTLIGLADRGLLISDLDRHSEFRNREAKLNEGGWAPWASAFHYSGRWEGHTALGRTPKDMDELLRLVAQQDHDHGQRAPTEAEPTFPSPRSGSEVELTAPTTDGGEALGELAHLLERRLTVREYDPGVPLTERQLTQLLYSVWGCRGVDGDGPNQRMRRSSPSAGALHPTEVYPLVLRVEGVEPGLYHYQSEHHTLRLVHALPAGEAAELADVFTAGQFYPRGAQALFVMCTRFRRNFWKYREHVKAYRTLLLDVGHLSQTFYLACTALGLGPFFTSAINEVDVERALGLDPAEEGALGICGCGAPAADLRFSMRASM